MPRDDRATAVQRQAGRVAVVTGGAGGIGSAVARRLAEDGARVAVLGLDQPAAADVAAALPHGGLGIRCDITDPAEVAEAVETVQARLGGIDILVNSAGRLANADFLQMTGETWDAGIAANLTGPFHITRAVAAVMRAGGYGRIILVSSLAALGNRSQANYASAKAGVAGLARTVAIELGEFGITCNVVAPGFVRTEMLLESLRVRGVSLEDFEQDAAGRIAVRRIGCPEDIAAAVAFFALPESGFVTGQTLYATGNPSA